MINSIKGGYINPVLLALALAPEDDEPLSDEEKENIRISTEEVNRGEFYTMEEMAEALGF